MIAALSCSSGPADIAKRQLLTTNFLFNVEVLMHWSNWSCQVRLEYQSHFGSAGAGAAG